MWVAQPIVALLAVDDPAQADYVPDANVFHSDNRSSYNGLLMHLQGSVGPRASLIANYTFSKAQTWVVCWASCSTM